MEYILILLILLAFLIIGIIPIHGNYGKKYFLIANRELDALSAGSSIMASKIGGGLIVTYSAMFFTYGFGAIGFFIGASIGYFIFNAVVKDTFVRDKLQGKGIYNLQDTVNKVFDTKTSITGKIISYMVTFTMFGWIITNLYIGSNLLINITELSRLFILFTIASIVCSYLIYGGMGSVVRTDKVQLVMIFILFVIIAYIIWNGSNIQSNVNITTEQKVPWVGFIIIGLLFPFGSAEIYQRITACSTPREAKKAIKYSAIVYSILGIILSFICYKVSGMPNIEQIAIDDRLSIGVKNYLQDNFSIMAATLWIAALITIIISSVDTFIFITASSFIQNRQGDKKMNRHTINNVRTSIIGFTLLAIIIVLGVAKLEYSVAHITLFFVGITLIISGAFLVLIWNKFFLIDDRKMSRILVISTVLFIVSYYQLEYKSFTAAIGCASVILLSLYNKAKIYR